MLKIVFVMILLALVVVIVVMGNRGKGTARADSVLTLFILLGNLQHSSIHCKKYEV